MACLNKLAIRGIRSFDDKQIAVIEFFSPVTVIVGHNGSGKTTIIECLKYATTGEQPPNTRGGAFIHDPKMANEKEVKAQVKLRFHAANGQRMLVVRNLSVTVKKTAGLTMKTLESILSLADGNGEKTGKRATISTKCAEMDVEIPHLLGVSKSVLENVIFCHQEDSYWPLAEPAALKKKFDDIFEATRYTKALDSIKSLRKDRLAELKADKERLDSLAREKSHADKLKARISEMKSNISMKEIEHENLKSEYETLVLINQKFYESSMKFRELYIRYEGMQASGQKLQEQISEMKQNLREVSDTDQELDARLVNFDKHIKQTKQKLLSEQALLQDREDELANTRKSYMGLVQAQGQLVAEEKQHERNIAERDNEIRRIADVYQIKGYDHFPLEREQIIMFVGRLQEMQRKHNVELDNLKAENEHQNDEYSKKSRQLHAELEGLKQQKISIRKQISALQSSITKAESEFDSTESLTGSLLTLQSDIEDKKTKVEKTRVELKNINFEEKMADRNSKLRNLEERRDLLNSGLRSLSLQADSRARLDIKRTELKAKTHEVKNMVDLNNVKFRKLVGKDIRLETMERDIDAAISEKERECAEIEADHNSANKSLQLAETNLSNSRSQLKQKRDEVKVLDRKLQAELEGEYASVKAAVEEANSELSSRRELSGSLAGTSQIFESLLKLGKAKKICTACNRPLADHEMAVFEKYLKEEMKKNSPELIQQYKRELAEWEEALKEYQSLLPVESTRDNLKSVEIPKLEALIKEQEAALPAASNLAEMAQNNLDEVKKTLKELMVMKQHAQSVVKLQLDIQRLKEEISRIEGDLATSGSTKTADDVQGELNRVADEIRTAEREKQALLTERERLNTLQRTHEHDLHNMQLQESNLKGQVRDRNLLQSRIESMRKEVSEEITRQKELDESLSVAQAPIAQLTQEEEKYKAEYSGKLEKVQHFCDELRRNAEALERANKSVEIYIRDRRGRQLKDCNEQVEMKKEEIKDFDSKIEAIRGNASNLEREIHEGGATIVYLRENVRFRKLKRDYVAVQDELSSIDIEEAAKARRQFNDKYGVEKSRETDLQGNYAHLGGQLSSSKSQLETLENDLKDFKDINKRYTDQLIKVKMSDMANNDLEKYGKALDNAIMKYHSLKMEEVNDTMRHLWNKTYQGTDIDGIKVRSDVEGGASKRSYNYRVVMTKDQVEMDMRGRCSAGQKMLASIIIRLALSDSFGQNCGILALDEPTNALDVENIDALAASLVDIINERKNHSNFQLVIITHDENFLRKLGQADVMEYYWRVSRDSRQKSVIERQRIG